MRRSTPRFFAACSADFAKATQNGFVRCGISIPRRRSFRGVGRFAFFDPGVAAGEDVVGASFVMGGCWAIAGAIPAVEATTAANQIARVEGNWHIDRNSVGCVSNN